MTQLIIFDCDGVLVDSERLLHEVLIECFADFGLYIPFDTAVSLCKGYSRDTSYKNLEEYFCQKIPAEVSDAASVKISYALENHVEAVDGVEELICSLNGPCCVASSGRHQKMQITLGRTGLDKYFEGRIFSAEDVGKGKPEPDLFLYAAEQMGFAPEACTVIEDSPPGVIAAKRAGMKVFGYPNLTPPEMLEEHGAVVFYEMRELQGLLA